MEFSTRFGWILGIFAYSQIKSESCSLAINWHLSNVSIKSSISGFLLFRHPCMFNCVVFWGWDEKSVSEREIIFFWDNLVWRIKCRAAEHVKCQKGRIQPSFFLFYLFLTAVLSCRAGNIILISQHITLQYKQIIIMVSDFIVIHFLFFITF